MYNSRVCVIVRYIAYFVVVKIISNAMDDMIIAYHSYQQNYRLGCVLFYDGLLIVSFVDGILFFCL